MSGKKISAEGPTEIDRGYYEFRVNWDGATLLLMTGEELERFKSAIATFRQLAGHDAAPEGP